MTWTVRRGWSAESRDVLFRRSSRATSRACSMTYRMQYALGVASVMPCAMGKSSSTNSDTRKSLLACILLCAAQECSTAESGLKPPPGRMPAEMVSLKSGPWSGSRGVPSADKGRFPTLSPDAPYRSTASRLVVRLTVPRSHCSVAVLSMKPI